MWRLLWLSLPMAVVAIVSCDEGHDITYLNGTDSTIRISIDGLLELTLEPHETRDALILRFAIPKLFEAKDQEGSILFSERLTWEDLKGKDWKIVITKSSGGRAESMPTETVTPSSSGP